MDKCDHGRLPNTCKQMEPQFAYLTVKMLRVIPHETPFNPSSVPHAATTNKGAAATAHISGIQAALHIERHKLSSHTQWIP